MKIECIRYRLETGFIGVKMIAAVCNGRANKVARKSYRGENFAAFRIGHFHLQGVLRVEPIEKRLHSSLFVEMLLFRISSGRRY